MEQNTAAPAPKLPIDESTRTKQALLAADNRARANELLTRMLSSIRSEVATTQTGLNIYLDGAN